ncbi:MAG TPA: 50S ribosomal protein L1 [Nitrososphaeraceae archaeon]
MTAYMITGGQLGELVKRAREGATKRNFDQSVELTLVLKDIDVKRGFSINEVIELPNKISNPPRICVVGSGDLSTRAKKAGIDRIIEPDELDRLGTNRREARKIVRAHDFFLADTSLMPNVGRSLGQFLGPQGKMPTPLQYGAPIETLSTKFRNSVRVRTKNQLNLAAKIGDEKMEDSKLVSNAETVVTELEKKLPQGGKNIQNAVVKFTMGSTAKLSMLKKDKGA